MAGLAFSLVGVDSTGELSLARVSNVAKYMTLGHAQRYELK